LENFKLKERKRCQFNWSLPSLHARNGNFSNLHFLCERIFERHELWSVFNSYI